MKPCRIVAISLIGWYLLAPPPMKDNRDVADLKAPLSRWLMIGQSFDTVDDCEETRAGVKAALNVRPESEVVEAGDASRCIASDDPRLKEK